MVNTELPGIAAARAGRRNRSDSRGKPRLPSVNQFLSKPFEFSKNSRSIVFECAQKPEQALQACLLAYVMPRHDRRRRETP
jgi:hypothetical protein